MFVHVICHINYIHLCLINFFDIYLRLLYTTISFHTPLHLGFSARMRIWQVPACKMELRSGNISWKKQPPTHDMDFSCWIKHTLSLECLCSLCSVWGLSWILNLKSRVWHSQLRLFELKSPSLLPTQISAKTNCMV